MTAPTTHGVVLNPPHPGIHQDTKETYKYLYELWKRTGGFNSAITDLEGLEASVGELNTLKGVRTNLTVQEQFDQVMQVLDLSITSAGNSGATETTLTSYTLAANKLASQDYLEIYAAGTYAANANNKTVKLKIGSSTLLDTGAIAANGGSWSITSKIVHDTTTTVKAVSDLISGNALVTNNVDVKVAVANLAAALNIYCTGHGTATNDIVQQMLIVKWYQIYK